MKLANTAIRRRNRRASLAALALAVALVSVAWSRHENRATGVASAIAKVRSSIAQDWHGEIRTQNLQADIASSVTLATRPVQIADLPSDMLLPALSSLHDAMAIYPVGFLNRILKRVVLAGHVTMWGHEVGGFFFNDTVALNDDNVEHPDGAIFSADSFHHELSSIVRNQILFNVSDWTASNPPGFSYLSLEAYKSILAKPPSVDGDAALHANGFVATYGMTSLDNDWNTYAEKVFGHGPQFAKLIRSYPRMQAKTRQLLDVYAGLDAAFERYFHQSGLRRATEEKGVPFGNRP